MKTAQSVIEKGMEIFARCNIPSALIANIVRFNNFAKKMGNTSA